MSGLQVLEEMGAAVASRDRARGRFAIRRLDACLEQRIVALSRVASDATVSSDERVLAMAARTVARCLRGDQVAPSELETASRVLAERKPDDDEAGDQ